MRNWDPLAIFKYLTGAIPTHVAIIVFIIEADIYDDSYSMNPNFPD